VRLSPDGRLIVYIAGLGQRPPQPAVTTHAADGAAFTIAPGHHPCWLDDRAVVYCPQTDGAVQAFGAAIPAIPAGNTLTAGGGIFAVHRTDPRRVLLSTGRVIPGATDPVLSRDGVWLAYLLPDLPISQATLVVERAQTGTDRRTLYVGAPARPRFSHTGTSLCWEGGGGQIYGVADVANPQAPVTLLSRPADRLYHPVPCWHPGLGLLFVLAVQDHGATGKVVLMTWESCHAQAPMGRWLTTSTGSAYDHDIAPDGPSGVLACYLSPEGLLKRLLVDLSVGYAPIALPPVPEPPTPDPNRWTVVPHGTLVTGALRVLLGDHPNQQGDIICLNKNTHPEAEWRRVAGGRLLHWADASRFPGDRGWWIEPAPLWAWNSFASGDSAATENARLIDFHNGTTNRWRQTNTLYGVVGGGVMIQFDPRFPGQYTDMAKQGTPQWAPAGYEKQWVLPDGSAKWQYIVTPLAAKGRIPWGDPSMDVVIQEAENGPRTGPATPQPFIPCPRPLTTTPAPQPNPTDPPKPPPMPDPKPDLRGIPRDQIALMADAIDLYLRENPRLGLGDGLLTPDAGDRPLSHALDAVYAYLLSECLGAFQAGGPLPGDAAGYDQRRDAALAHTFHVIEQERGTGPKPKPQPGPAAAKPIGVSGRDFITP
jgi:hypothetical protein